mmetsp:Transcript_4410/g.11556  ORF Transcript_4410/g.11556 Transcript_4410/m.11556 type:complete len:127 (+) Transcript_4410:36-416(+)
MLTFSVIAAMPALAAAFSASSSATFGSRAAVRVAQPAMFAGPELLQPDALMLPTTDFLADVSVAYDISELSIESKFILVGVYGLGFLVAFQAFKAALAALAKGSKVLLQVGFFVALFELFGVLPPP